MPSRPAVSPRRSAVTAKPPSGARRETIEVVGGEVAVRPRHGRAGRHAHHRHGAAGPRQVRHRGAVVVAVQDEFGPVPGDHGLERPGVAQAPAAFRAPQVRRVVDHDDADESRRPGIVEEPGQPLPLRRAERPEASSGAVGMAEVRPMSARGPRRRR